jgi:hypothetical protein
MFYKAVVITSACALEGKACLCFPEPVMKAIERKKLSTKTKICNADANSEERIEKSLVEEVIRKNRELGGDARQSV